jgi:pimeloyl-ACP methyl ester carboxylesterase
MPSRRQTLTAGVAAAAALPGGVTLAQAQAPAAPALPYRPHAIRTPDGLTLAAYEYGNPSGPAILFVHGYAQAALSWDRQTRDADLAREFRMVALDLRGHGMSDKPIGDAHYRTPKLWADDVQATIAQIGLARPTLVGWSYGGRVMGDYVNEHGTGGIGAMNWVCAVSSSAEPSRFGRGGRFIAPMTSPDPATAIRGTVGFLRECFELQPSTGDFETMLAFNMMVPRHVRISLGGRRVEFEERLRTIDLPVLVTQGQLDKLIDVTMGRHTAAIIPGARYSEYQNIGHAPFWEDAPRFNRELAELARSARR